MVWKLGHFGAFVRLDASGGAGKCMEETSGRDQIGAIRTEGRNGGDTNQSGRKTCVLCHNRVRSTEDQNISGLLIGFFYGAISYSKSPFAGSDLCYWQTNQVYRSWLQDIWRFLYLSCLACSKCPFEQPLSSPRAACVLLSWLECPAKCNCTGLSLFFNIYFYLYGSCRAWDGWMASLTQWAWIWASSGSWVMDREAWRAAVHRVTKSRTRLSNWAMATTLRISCGLGDLRPVTQESLLIVACGILVLWPGMEPLFPALQGNFWTAWPPGESLGLVFEGGFPTEHHYFETGPHSHMHHSHLLI